MKIGSTDLVLSMLEEGYVNNLDFELLDPVQAVKEVSRDLNLDKKLKLVSGESLTAIEIQNYYLSKAINFNLQIAGSKYFEKIIEMWTLALDLLKQDSMKLIGKIDWITKKFLIEKMDKQSNLNSNDIVKTIDFQYSEITNSENIFNILKRNKIVNCYFQDSEIDLCETSPPLTTRAFFRASMLKKYPIFISAASWDNVILDLNPNQSLLRIPTTDPYGFNFETHSLILDEAKNIHDLVSVLSKPGTHR